MTIETNRFRVHQQSMEQHIQFGSSFLDIFVPFSQCVELGEIVWHAEQTVQYSHLRSQHS